MLKSRGFYKGVNLGGWLSQCDYSEERLNGFITEGDIDVIASWGIDHVRIPIDYNVLENEDGSYKEDGFRRVDSALSWCFRRGLNVVVDLHKTAGFSFDFGERESGFFESEKLQQRFYALWEKIAERYGKFHEDVAFELLNEVTDRSFIGEWNRISRCCIEKIRVFAPKTLILVGSYHNNSAPAVKDLDAPFDENVVYNFHCYDPLKFTHQGATWTELIDPEVRVGFDSCEITTQFFLDWFAGAAEAAKKNGTVLYCGEYGVIDRATPEDTVKWYKAINAAFEQLGISRSAWSYKEMDFGLSDARLDCVRDELVKYL